MNTPTERCLANKQAAETDRLRLLSTPDDGRRQGPYCGKTQSHDGHVYPPCARPAGHIEAYCRDNRRTSYFIAAEPAGSRP